MIVDYCGAIVSKQSYSNGSTFVTGAINIEALRHDRRSAQAIPPRDRGHLKNNTV
jgi:beta-ureidopropionase